MSGAHGPQRRRQVDVIEDVKRPDQARPTPKASPLGGQAGPHRDAQAREYAKHMWYIYGVFSRMRRQPGNVKA